MVFKIETFSKKFVWFINFAFLTLIRAKISTIEGIVDLSFMWEIDKLVCSWNTQQNICGVPLFVQSIWIPDFTKKLVNLIDFDR